MYNQGRRDRSVQEYNLEIWHLILHEIQPAFPENNLRHLHLARVLPGPDQIHARPEHHLSGPDHLPGGFEDHIRVTVCHHAWSPLRIQYFFRTLSAVQGIQEALSSGRYLPAFILFSRDDDGNLFLGCAKTAHCIDQLFRVGFSLFV